ncbi:hypothetical protein [Chamaesiphon sp. GL140_3_metabinner_50]|nr:hypothetical protein [Chamaesiphon sp. GL140_3_metabinner_50]
MSSIARITSSILLMERLRQRVAIVPSMKPVKIDVISAPLLGIP